MTFLTFAMAIGLAGAAFLLGIMVATLRASAPIRGVGLGMASMLLAGGLAALHLARAPLVEPLWLQYALVVGIPFLLGFGSLMALTARRSRDDH